MSMTKIEYFIDYYKTHYEQQMYNPTAFEYTVLEALGDMSEIIDFLQGYQDVLNHTLVDRMVEKYS